PVRRGDVPREVLGVAGHPAEPTRAPRVLPRQAEEVQAGTARHAAGVGRVPAPVENRYVDPAVVAAEAGAPDDGGDPGRGEVERGRLCVRYPDRRVPRLRRRLDAP